MKTSIKNKKGFTIVELVIVIAVIAILAAVLIPTFADLVKRANESVDIQIVRQMNLVLQAEEVSAGKPATVIDAKKILIANGCDDFTPSDSDNVYYWVAGDNHVLLWNNSESKVIFPDELAKKYADYTEPSADWADLAASADEYIEVVPTEGQTVYQALIAVLQNAKDGDAIRLPENSEVKLETEGDTFSNTYLKHSDTSIGKRITIDLNGGKLISNINNSGGINVPDNGSLTLINGDVEITTKGGSIAAIAPQTGSTLILRNIDLKSNGSPVYPKGDASEVILDNCMVSGGSFALATNGQYSDNVRITINNSELSASTCVLVNTQSRIFINDSTLTGEVHALVVRCGYASVGNSTLITTDTIPGIFSYKALATNERGTWIDGNGFPAATLVAGDYSKSNSEGAYSYKGNVTVYLQNVKLQSADAAAVPNVLMAALDPDKTVALTYDSASTVDVLKIYGEDWVGLNTDKIQSQSATFKHNGTITVNGETKTLGD